MGEDALTKLKRLEEISRPRMKMIYILVNDVVVLQERAANGGQLERRQLVRALFAYIEADINLHRKEALEYNEFFGKNRFSAQEIARLEGVKSLDESGFISEVSQSSKLMPTMLFAFRMSLKALGIEDQDKKLVDCGSHKYKALKKAKKTRDRLTHPRSAADLEVHDDALKELGLGVDWYKETSSTMWEKLNEALKPVNEEYNRMREEEFLHVPAAIRPKLKEAAARGKRKDRD